MADQTSLLSLTKNATKPTSTFLNSPRFFNGETTLTSPTSILDTKNSSNFVNPFGYEKFLPKSQNPSHEIKIKLEREAIGLALIDSLNEEKNDGNFSKPINRMVLFGSKLKVQISDMESPKSAADFGIKTRNSQFLSSFADNPVKDFTRQLSLKEMELCEDYTCVITHGPNPKTTHIFDDCIVERCCGDDDDDDVRISDHKKMDSCSCHTCKDSLGQGKDIYMYRGEKAFCCHECRCHGMLLEGTKNP